MKWTGKSVAMALVAGAVLLLLPAVAGAYSPGMMSSPPSRPDQLSPRLRCRMVLG